VAVKVISRRLFRISQKENFIPLLKQLQESAREQPGFISRATCSSLKDPGEYIVISEWESADDWIAWMGSKQVRDIQWKIDSLVGEKTFFDIYRPEEF
jgi:heme-degrading monooxygenase HmoA